MSSRQKKDWNIDTLLSVLGFVFELMRVVVTALRKRGGGIDHLRRLLKEPALVDKVFDMIVDKATEMVLRAGEYLVNVTYAALPSMTEIERLFTKNGVSVPLIGSYKWEQDRSREHFDSVPGHRVILLKYFTPEEIEEMGGLEDENIIAWGLKNGYVPADRQEAYAFGINPDTRDLQLQFRIIALGSYTLLDDDRFVAVLGSYSGGRIFDTRRSGSEWDSDDHFLFVRTQVALGPLVTRP